MTKTTPVAAEAVIHISGVHKHYGAVHAVNGVDLSIEPGEVFGLIGHNGAGKSTLFKMMLGLIPATRGEIRVGGALVQGPQFRDVRRHMGYLPENVVLSDNLTGLGTLHFFAKRKGVPTQQCGAVLERVGLSHAADRAVQGYSKGMRQRLGFAQALLGQPKVLFLDEPTTGLDPQAIRSFYATLKELRSQGVTMILTSHILAELQERVDRLAIMAAGRIQALGSVQALREQVNMPLSVQVQCPAHAVAEIQTALSGLNLSVQTNSVTPLILTMPCPRDQKMAVLRTLAGMADLVQDIQVFEPSLEDVFFDFAA